MSTWFNIINKNKFNGQKANLFIFPDYHEDISNIKYFEKGFSHIKLFRTEYPYIDKSISSYPFSRFDTLVNKLYEELVHIISNDQPYYFFAYDYGKEVIKRLSIKIITNNILRPSGIIIFNKIKNNYSIDDSIKIFLPVLRSDYLFEDNYILDEFLNPILGLIKRRGDKKSLKQLIKWKVHNYSEFCQEYIKGDKMVLNFDAKIIMDQIDLFILSYNKIYSEEFYK